ncbi:MAG TPA: tetratricopeptide repeat protein [Thermoanaerobaculia bacterium]|nr:tetratricopeptide repeat protein [Thermoanaerobaculia bacterium]
MVRRLSTCRELVDLLGGPQAAPTSVAALLEHHLEVCPTCRELGIKGSAVGPPLPNLRAAFAGALERAAQQTLVLDRLNQDAQRELGELLALPAERRRLKISRSFGQFRNPVLVELLIRESRRQLASAPYEAYELAECACDVALRLVPTELGRAWAMTAVARSHAHRANALRVTGDFRRASSLLSFSWEIFRREGNGDPLTEGELLELAAVLKRDQRRFGEAERLLAQALELYERCQQAGAIHRVGILRGSVLFDAGQVESAIEITGEALAGLDPAREPRLYLIAQHNLVDFLQAMGRFREARQRLEEISPLYDRLANRGELLRRQWVEGRIARGLGDTAAAEQALNAARQGFLEQNLVFDAALVALDLALLRLEQGRSQEVRELAEEMVPIFLAQDVRREATAAVLLFQQAARNEAATGVMVSELMNRLRRLASRFET